MNRRIRMCISSSPTASCGHAGSWVAFIVLWMEVAKRMQPLHLGMVRFGMDMHA